MKSVKEINKMIKTLDSLTIQFLKLTNKNETNKTTENEKELTKLDKEMKSIVTELEAQLN